MAIASKTHWLGVFLLFVSSVLLLITTISAPVINHVGLLRITLQREVDFEHTSVSFGTFGYCVLDIHQEGKEDFCTKSKIGYAPAQVMESIDGSDSSVIASGTSESLTRVMVLHPIEAGIAFIAFLMSLGSGMIGSFAGAMVAFLAWILTLISLAIDFSLFGIIHHNVNENGRSEAKFGAGIWCITAAFVTLFFGMIIVFFTCCSARREKRRTKVVEKEPATYRRRKRFGLF